MFGSEVRWRFLKKFIENQNQENCFWLFNGGGPYCMESSPLTYKANIIETSVIKELKTIYVNLRYETFIIFLETLNIALWRI